MLNVLEIPDAAMGEGLTFLFCRKQNSFTDNPAQANSGDVHNDKQ